MARRSSADRQRAGEVVDGRQAEQDGVEAVEDPAVAGQERAEVLDAEVALEHRLAEVAERRDDRHDDAERAGASVSSFHGVIRFTMTTATTIDAAMPPIRPSIVLLGEIAGASRVFPNCEPTM